MFHGLVGSICSEGMEESLCRLPMRVIALARPGSVSYTHLGTYIPMYFMVEDSWASFAASFGEEYADQVMAVMPMWSIILVIAGIFVFAIFGGLLGKALLKKHFAKAGIA